jgi:hypothetical protein
VTKKKRPAQRWGFVFYEDRGAAPAYDWLLSLPKNIRTEFTNTIEAVLLSQNPPAAYLMNRWHAMKEVGKVDMGGYHEARDQFGGTNYRLFCRFDQAAADVEELRSPVLVILHGASKPDRNPMPDTVYEHVQEAWARYFRPERRCSGIDFPPVELEASP